MILKAGTKIKFRCHLDELREVGVPEFLHSYLLRNGINGIIVYGRLLNDSIWYTVQIQYCFSNKLICLPERFVHRGIKKKRKINAD